MGNKAAKKLTTSVNNNTIANSVKFTIHQANFKPNTNLNHNPPICFSHPTHPNTT